MACCVHCAKTQGALCSPPHTGVKHSWHCKAGDTWASCVPEAPEHLLCQPHFLVLSPSLDVSSFCHIGILSQLCLSLQRGLPGTQGCLGDRMLPTIWGVLLNQDCSSSSSVLAPGHASDPLEPWPSQLLSKSCPCYVRQTMLPSLPILLYNLSNQNPEGFVFHFVSLSAPEW